MARAHNKVNLKTGNYKKTARNRVKAKFGIKSNINGFKVPQNVVDSHIQNKMGEDYISMWHQYEHNARAKMQKETRQRATDRATSKNKETITKASRETLKNYTNKRREFSKLLTPEQFVNSTQDEQEKAYVEIIDYIKSIQKTQAIRKADKEVMRSRLMRTTKTPLEVRRYLAKADLDTAVQYIDFINEAKRRAKNVETYEPELELFYDDVPVFKSSGKQILANFIRYQAENTKGDDIHKLLNNASRIKVGGKSLFTYEEIEGYI